MAVSDRKLRNKISTPILVQHHIFFCGCANEQIHLSLFVSLIRYIDPVIVGNTGVGLRLLVLVAFPVVILLVMDGVIEGEAVNVATHTCCYNSRIVVGNRNLLDVVRKGE